MFLAQRLLSTWIITLSMLLFSVCNTNSAYSAETTGELCAHKIDTSQCILCTASAREKKRLWCRGHDRYEDRCWMCHPEIEDKKRAFCENHGLYEDECFICDPKLLKAPQEIPQQAVTKPVTLCPHKIDVAQCILCTSAAREKNRLWCRGHDRYEDRCWMCHPELEDKKRAFCEDHGLYADECFICNPKLLFSQGPQTGIPKLGLTPTLRLECKEHDMFEDECAICHPELAPALAPGENLKVRFRSKISASLAGVSTANPHDFTGTEKVKSYVEVSYNRNALVHITPVVTGIVQKVLVDVGDSVQKNDVLVEIFSTDLANAKFQFINANLEYSMAQQEHQRQQELDKDRIAAKRDVQIAAAKYEQAQVAQMAATQSLRNLTLNDQDIAHIASTQNTDAILQIKAPFVGTVIARDLALGSAVKTGDTLLQIADLSQMWLNLSIPEEHLALIHIGQTIEAQFGALSDTSIQGKISWISSSVDAQSRLIQARAVVKNPQQQLKSGLFGKAFIFTSASNSGLGIPASAIQRLEHIPYVFVRDQDDLYSLRRIELGPRIGDQYLVRKGLTKKDNVVVSNSYIIYSEMFKSKLGAGCTDH